MKKMKKRRELDALVNGKLGRRKKGQHELLRNDSESSEVEEFSIPNKAVMRKSSSCRFCATCMTVCGFFLLVACIAAIAGLVWVHIEMKREVDQLRSQIAQVQMNQPQGLVQVSKKQEKLEQEIDDLKKKDVTNIQLNISKLFAQMKALNASLNKPSEEIPKTDYSSVIQNVATFGSTLQTLDEKVKLLTEQQETITSQAQKIAMIDDLAADIDSINFTMSSHFHEHLIAINILKNKTDSLNLRLSLVSAKPGTPAQLPNIENLVQNAIHNSLQDIQNLTQSQIDKNGDAVGKLEATVVSLQEQVGSINETLTFVKSEVQQDRNEELGKPSTVSPNPNLATVLGDYGQFKNKTITHFQELKTNMDSLDGRLKEVEHTMQNLPATPSDMVKDMMTGDGDHKTTNTKSDLLSADQGTRGESITTTQSVNDYYYLHSDMITKREDLGNFVLWDKDGDEKLTLEELNTVLYPDIIDENEFNTFDKDFDGKLTKEELIDAFGFGDSSEEAGENSEEAGESSEEADDYEDMEDSDETEEHKRKKKDLELV